MKIFKNKFLIFGLTFLIVANVTFYIKEKEKWIYKGQPYSEAKKWLIPANIVLVYGTWLTKLPLIDERSLIMKPIISLQDYFVSNWQKNLPDNDAEKYLGWYIFKHSTYLIPNAKSILLYNDGVYGFIETWEATDKAWEIIDSIVKYEAKDSEFNKIRYSAFLNLSFFYVKNASAFWYNANKGFFNKEMMFKDRKRMKRFYKLYDYIIKMDNYYERKFPQIFNKLINKSYENSTEYILTDFILRDFLNQAEEENKVELFCENLKENKYFTKHSKNKDELLKILSKVSLLEKDSINRELNSSVDKKINQICINKGEI